MGRNHCLVILVGLLVATVPAQAQWFDIADPMSNAVCGVINAEGGVLMVIDNNSNLVLIRGTDLTLTNTWIDEYLVVYVDDVATGTIDFASDRQGRRRAFWITQIGSLYGLTPDGAAEATDTYPESVEAFCDPCEFWDDQTACVDAPLDEGTDTTTNLGGALLASLCGAGGDTAVPATTLGLICLLILPAVRPRP
jgi:hypothetical protein